MSTKVHASEKTTVCLGADRYGRMRVASSTAVVEEILTGLVGQTKAVTAVSQKSRLFFGCLLSIFKSVSTTQI